MPSNPRLNQHRRPGAERLAAFGEQGAEARGGPVGLQAVQVEAKDWKPYAVLLVFIGMADK